MSVTSSISQCTNSGLISECDSGMTPIILDQNNSFVIDHQTSTTENNNNNNTLQQQEPTSSASSSTNSFVDQILIIQETNSSVDNMITEQKQPKTNILSNNVDNYPDIDSAHEHQEQEELAKCEPQPIGVATAASSEGLAQNYLPFSIRKFDDASLMRPSEASSSSSSLLRDNQTSNDSGKKKKLTDEESALRKSVEEEKPWNCRNFQTAKEINVHEPLDLEALGSINTTTLIDTTHNVACNDEQLCQNNNNVNTSRSERSNSYSGDGLNEGPHNNDDFSAGNLNGSTQTQFHAGTSPALDRYVSSSSSNINLNEVAQSSSIEGTSPLGAIKNNNNNQYNYIGDNDKTTTTTKIIAQSNNNKVQTTKEQPSNSYQQETATKSTNKTASSTISATASNINNNKQQPSSRFFPSKLNTGSLWSLLSGGVSEQPEESSSRNNEHGPNDGHVQVQTSGNNNNPKDTSTTRLPQGTISTTSTFFERAVQFSKRGQQQAEHHWSEWNSSSNKNNNNNTKQQHNLLDNWANQMGHSQSRGSSTDLSVSKSRGNSTTGPQTASSKTMVRFKFPLKYVGSSMLHKNFTLPMLEWVAKDIRRHTMKAAELGRQFALRDIVLEIQSKQLVASNCKDGHCVFVHPMHCVSKYVQLKLDQNCFAYIIRDTKDSPQFVHVFQAKSASKVHEIFDALREVTRLPQQQQQQQQKQSTIQNSNNNNTDSSSSSSAKQTDSNEASNDASHSRRISLTTQTSLTSANADQGQCSAKFCTPGSTSNPSQTPVHTTNTSMPPPSTSRFTQVQKSVSLDHGNTRSSQVVNSNTNQDMIHQYATRDGLSVNSKLQVGSTRNECLNLDNSYQFEVMFVKRVKLQCRRVPASFVDDALETLKSFDVLKCGESKASQIKGKSRATIINASVDERQEYDDVAQASDDSTESSCRRTSLISQSETLKSSLRSDNQDQLSSRSCQQSPTKTASNSNSIHTHQSMTLQNELDLLKKHHSSMESLNGGRGLPKETSTKYTNDFSPYNTISSSGLNERIAAIPVVSHGSVSLDHETRQRLARQVRQTIQATAANIKKDVYENRSDLSCLKQSLSLKAIDSLSCTVASEVPSVMSSTDGDDSTLNSSGIETTAPSMSNDQSKLWSANNNNYIQSDGANSIISSGNNFDLFRRASARQVVKNRTMLLLIGKEQLCTISIDKHQMLFSKSFSQIMHCLQGNNNKEHFGLICRDSNKINPSSESYAGFIFMCQSEKVVREIMGALKQVIYNSQHNYHAYYSLYNPLHQSHNKQPQTTTQLYAHKAVTPIVASSATTINPQVKDSSEIDKQQQQSLAVKRGFTKPLEPLEVGQSKSNIGIEVNVNSKLEKTASASYAATAPVGSPKSDTNDSIVVPKQPVTKLNLIRTMFCDNCPLYWFHRLCCDVESLPSEASKAIILRRIDSSLSEKEQDELYSRFSNHQIESIEEHNVIFMSLLRHLCESKQSKHAQSSSHLNDLAKNLAILKQQQQQSSNNHGNVNASGIVSSASNFSQPAKQIFDLIKEGASGASGDRRGPSASSITHQRSGSTGGSFGFSLHTNHQVDAMESSSGVAAIDNLKRAKNTISVSIENMLKRRSSLSRDNEITHQSSGFVSSQELPLMRSGSLRINQHQARAEVGSSHTDTEGSPPDNCSNYEGVGSGLKRSQSSTDSYGRNNNQPSVTISWKDSLSRTLQDDLANPFVGLFRRRSSTLGGQQQKQSINNGHGSNFKTSSESLSGISSQNSTSKQGSHSPKLCNTPNYSASNEAFQVQPSSGGSMLSSVFWKKSLFDKIRQPSSSELSNSSSQHNKLQQVKRSKQELRALWRKAIMEQITLLKMDKQNQRLVGAANSARRSPTIARPPSTENNESGDSEGNVDSTKIKLNYKEIPYSREANVAWIRLLKEDPLRKVEFVQVAKLIRLGVPKRRRGEIWMFLMNQYQLRHGNSFQPADEFKGDANQNYRGLLSQLSVQQHEIFVDIGKFNQRTARRYYAFPLYTI